MCNNLNVSIVLYNSNYEEIAYVVELLRSNQIVSEIYLVDNSSTPNDQFKTLKAIYIHTGKNLGYGTAHNIAIKKSIENGIKYHLVLNSDVCFNPNELSVLLKKMQDNRNIGLLMPSIMNADGSYQLLPKILPSPLNIILRSSNILRSIFKKTNRKYTLESYLHYELNVPIISGCFSLFRIEALVNVGLYDEKYFMYFEDFDISRRIHTQFDTIYFPSMRVVHAHSRGAANNLKLFIIFIESAIIYFNKYGWFFDSSRKIINRSVTTQLKKLSQLTSSLTKSSS